MDNYSLIQDLHDDIRFGQIRVFWDPSNEKDMIFQREKECVNSKQFKFNEILSQNRHSLNHQFLLPHKHFFADRKTLTINDYYFYPNTDLNLRQEFFQDPLEICGFLSDMLHVTSYLEKNDMIHGNLRPELIYYDTENQRYTLIDNFDDNGDLKSLHLGYIQNNDLLFISDELFETLMEPSASENTRFTFQGECFSIGLLLIFMLIDTESYQRLFNMNEGIFSMNDFWKVKKYLTTQVFSGKDVQFIGKFLFDELLNENSQTRLTPIEAMKKFKKCFLESSFASIHLENKEKSGNNQTELKESKHSVAEEGDFVKFDSLPNSELKAPPVENHLTCSIESNSSNPFFKQIDSENKIKIEESSGFQVIDNKEPAPRLLKKNSDEDRIEQSFAESSKNIEVLEMNTPPVLNRLKNSTTDSQADAINLNYSDFWKTPEAMEIKRKEVELIDSMAQNLSDSRNAPLKESTTSRGFSSGFSNTPKEYLNESKAPNAPKNPFEKKSSSRQILIDSIFHKETPGPTSTSISFSKKNLVESVHPIMLDSIQPKKVNPQLIKTEQQQELKTIQETRHSEGFKQSLASGKIEESPLHGNQFYPTFSFNSSLVYTEPPSKKDTLMPPQSVQPKTLLKEEDLPQEKEKKKQLDSTIMSDQVKFNISCQTSLTSMPQELEKKDPDRNSFCPNPVSTNQTPLMKGIVRNQFNMQIISQKASVKTEAQPPTLKKTTSYSKLQKNTNPPEIDLKPDQVFGIRQPLVKDEDFPDEQQISQSGFMCKKKEVENAQALTERETVATRAKFGTVFKFETNNDKKEASNKEKPKIMVTEPAIRKLTNSGLSSENGQITSGKQKSSIQDSPSPNVSKPAMEVKVPTQTKTVKEPIIQHSFNKEENKQEVHRVTPIFVQSKPKVIDEPYSRNPYCLTDRPLKTENINSTISYAKPSSDPYSSDYRMEQMKKLQGNPYEIRRASITSEITREKVPKFEENALQEKRSFQYSVPHNIDPPPRKSSPVPVNDLAPRIIRVSRSPIRKPELEKNTSERFSGSSNWAKTLNMPGSDKFSEYLNSRPGHHQQGSSRVVHQAPSKINLPIRDPKATSERTKQVPYFSKG